MSDEHYYDIYVSACGFLNRLRTVEHSDGQSSLVCTFAALRGAKGERAQPTYFDAKIVGDRTKALLEQFRNVINDRTRQVFVSVRLSESREAVRASEGRTQRRIGLFAQDATARGGEFGGRWRLRLPAQGRSNRRGRSAPAPSRTRWRSPRPTAARRSRLAMRCARQCRHGQRELERPELKAPAWRTSFGAFAFF